MKSETEIWNLENEWLNAFAETFVLSTRRMVCDVAIETDDDIVVVCGRTRSYYAVQLAIHCVQSFNRDRSQFATTRLSLEVDDHSLELSISHQPDRAQVAEVSTKTNGWRRELSFA